MHEIRLARTDDDIASTFEIMAQLRPHLKRDAYVSQVRRLMERNGYQVAILTDGDAVEAVAGFRISESLAWATFVYVDDLVTNEKSRSHRHGQALLSWIADHGKARGCVQLHLDSGVQRHGAHRFYLRERMDITCYHFCRIL